jgi:hypothetical protein
MQNITKEITSKETISDSSLANIDDLLYHNYRDMANRHGYEINETGLTPWKNSGINGTLSIHAVDVKSFRFFRKLSFKRFDNLFPAYMTVKIGDRPNERYLLHIEHLSYTKNYTLNISDEKMSDLTNKISSN